MILNSDCKKILKDNKCCVIIPTYNNEKYLSAVITGVLDFCEDVIVVNDGSTDHTSEILQSFKQINLISYSQNKGKGYALRQAFNWAVQHHFDSAITIDSDGQHAPDDIMVFAENLIKEPNSLMIGIRNMPAENVNRKSTFANKFSNFWFHFITGIDLQDTQSGYRLYPINKLKDINYFTNKYEFEIEVLVRAAWVGIKIFPVPVKVFYPPQKERITHFRPFRDFGRISILNTALVFITLLYIKPFAFLKHLRKENIKNFFRTNLIETKDSNLKIGLSVMLGFFMGIIPIWGYQLIAAIALAHFLKLNKLIVIVTANISIPPMIPFILYFSYVTGGFVLGNHQSIHDHITFDFVKQNLMQYIIGSTLLASVFALCMGVVTFLFLSFLRKQKK